MTSGSDHSRFGPMMWGVIGVTFMVLAVVAVYGLNPRIAGYAVGTLVFVCLVVCVAAFWLDSQAARATSRLVDQLRSRRAGPPQATAAPPLGRKPG